jgi:hypothetical protein
VAGILRFFWRSAVPGKEFPSSRHGVVGCTEVFAVKPQVCRDRVSADSLRLVAANRVEVLRFLHPCGCRPDQRVSLCCRRNSCTRLIEI